MITTLEAMSRNKYLLIESNQRTAENFHDDFCVLTNGYLQPATTPCVGDLLLIQRSTAVYKQHIDNISLISKQCGDLRLRRHSKSFIIKFWSPSVHTVTVRPTGCSHCLVWVSCRTLSWSSVVFSSSCKANIWAHRRRKEHEGGLQICITSTF